MPDNKTDSAPAWAPLRGLTVVSFEQAVAAPYATRQLADLGARVIKIERPGAGDFARGYDETVRGMSSHFVWLNRSKQSVTLDLKSGPGREAARRLAARADVVVQNLAPGVAERLGLGAKELRSEHQSLIHASVSGYGSGGPFSHKKAYDLLIQCEAGLLAVTGSPGEPAKVGISVADIAAGTQLYQGILAALIERARSGKGVVIEISMLEAMAEWMGFPLAYTRYGGSAPARTGSNHAAIAPYGPFVCGDGNVVFLGVQNEREWGRFCEQILVAPRLATDPRFALNSSRVAHRDDLDAVIVAAFADRTAATITARLEELGIAAATLRDVQAVVDHPQLRARDRWRTHGSPVGDIRALLPPATPVGRAAVLSDVPALGEHTHQVLHEIGLVGPATCGDAANDRAS